MCPNTHFSQEVLQSIRFKLLICSNVKLIETWDIFACVKFSWAGNQPLDVQFPLHCNALPALLLLLNFLESILLDIETWFGRFLSF